MKKLFTPIAMLVIIFLSACGTEKDLSMEETVKIMTYNIRYDNPADSGNLWQDRKQLIADIIKNEKPDIIGIQEALKHQLDELHQLLPDYFWVGVGRDDGRDAGEFSPIFYNKKRFKKFASHTFWLSETPDTVSRGWDAACNRVCTYIKLKDLHTNKIVMAFNTHFDHWGKTAQVESARLLMRKVHWHSEDFPFVLTGDFNVTAESEAYNIIQTQVDMFKMLDSKDVSETAHKGCDITFNGFSNEYHPADCPIDHIFVRNETRVLSHKTIDTLINGKFPSDHFPVVTEVEFRKALN